MGASLPPASSLSNLRPSHSFSSTTSYSSPRRKGGYFWLSLPLSADLSVSRVLSDRTLLNSWHQCYILTHVGIHHRNPRVMHAWEHWFICALELVEKFQQFSIKICFTFFNLAIKLGILWKGKVFEHHVSMRLMKALRIVKLVFVRQLSADCLWFALEFYGQAFNWLRYDVPCMTARYVKPQIIVI